MRNNIFVAFLIALSFTTYGQLKINSPYSRFGVGDLKETGLVNNRGMAGLGASNGGIFFINNVNPAMLQRNKYTIYEIGLQNTARTLITNDNTSKNGDLNLDYLALALPLSKKWSAGVGLSQYSKVNYDITSTETINTSDYVKYNYLGSGGLNKFYLSNAYRILHDTSSATTISLGLEVSYLFGQIEKTSSSELFENGTSIGRIPLTREDNAYSSGNFKYGLSVRKELLYYNDVESIKTQSGLDSTTFNKYYSFKDIKDKTVDNAIIGSSMIIFPERRGVLLDRGIKKEEDIDRLYDLFYALAGANYGVYVKNEAKNLSSKELRTEFTALISGELAENIASTNDIDITSRFVRQHSGVYVNAGISFDQKTTLSGSSQKIIQHSTSTGTILTSDTISTIDATPITLPSSLVFGISIDKPEPKGKSKPSIWTAGVDVTLTNWKQYKDGSTNEYNNTYKIGVGGEYSPDPLLLSRKKSYWKKVTYRGGVYYGNTHYSIKQTTFNDLGINFGLSLPVGVFTGSNPPKHINLALTLGQRGTTTDNLIKEKYAVLSFSFNFNSRWFERYKLGL